MDGPCFHRAREALERIRSEGLACRLLFRDTPAERLFGLVASELVRQQGEWTDAQREVVARFLAAAAGALPSEPAQKDIAHELGVSESAVSQRLANANWIFHRAAVPALEAALAEIAGAPGEAG
jgi:hypothetical protein